MFIFSLFLKINHFQFGISFTEGPTEMSIFIIDQNHTCGKNAETRVGMSFRVISYDCITGRHYSVCTLFLKVFPLHLSRFPQEVWVRCDPAGKLSLWKDLHQLSNEIHMYVKWFHNTVLKRVVNASNLVSEMKMEIWNSWGNLITIWYQYNKTYLISSPDRK